METYKCNGTHRDVSISGCDSFQGALFSSVSKVWVLLSAMDSCSIHNPFFLHGCSFGSGRVPHWFFFQINFIGSDREALDNKRSDKTKILLDLGVDSSWKRETVLPL